MSENTAPLSQEEWVELCTFGALTCASVALTAAQASRADALGKRIKIQRPPPVPPPPGTMPPTIKIPYMVPADSIAGDPGGGGGAPIV
jgi:hypothetical protein